VRLEVKSGQVLRHTAGSWESFEISSGYEDGFHVYFSDTAALVANIPKRLFEEDNGTSGGGSYSQAVTHQDKLLLL